MIKCPICNAEAEEIDKGRFDGTGFRCKTHGDFRVAASVFSEAKERTPGQWKNALTRARQRTARGERPLITSDDF
jgi:hypothetical protein